MKLISLMSMQDDYMSDPLQTFPNISCPYTSPDICTCYVPPSCCEINKVMPEPTGCPTYVDPSVTKVSPSLPPSLTPSPTEKPPDTVGEGSTVALVVSVTTVIPFAILALCFS